jgi:putative tricarboxylic transport membrane protein
VMATPDWKEFMEKGAFNQTFMTGPDFDKWLTTTEAQHAELMKKAGFLATQ